MDDQEARAKAEQLNLQAGERYIKINAHIKVYGSRNADTEQLARNGIEFIEAALALVPNSPAYLNTYGLLVADGLGNYKLGLELLEKAGRLAPDDIQIQQNIRNLKAIPPKPRAVDTGAAVALIAGVVIMIIVAVLVALGFYNRTSVGEVGKPNKNGMYHDANGHWRNIKDKKP